MLQVHTHIIWERWRSQRGGNGILAKTWRWRKNQPDKKELYWVEKALLAFKSFFGYIAIPFFRPLLINVKLECTFETIVSLSFYGWDS